jgi:hypothetical protein
MKLAPDRCFNSRINGVPKARRVMKPWRKYFHLSNRRPGNYRQPVIGGYGKHLHLSAVNGNGAL